MQILLLGGFEVRGAEGQAIPLPTRKTALVLAALAVAGPKGLRRDVLAELIWPDRQEAQSKSSLRQALTAIRKLLSHSPDLALEADAECARLVGPGATIDCRQIEELADASDADRRLAAADLYRGDLLDGFKLDETLDAYFMPIRERLRRLALDLLETESQSGQISKSKRVRLEALARRLLTADAAAEQAHRALIRLFMAAGETTAARRQLEACREALAKDLGVEPEPQTIALLEPREPNGSKRTRADLGTASAGPGRRPSLVVMPFDELGPPQADFFADGVVEEITAALSRVREFFVIARQSAYVYKGRFADVREVGRQLGVRYVVEGTVRRNPDRVRISVQLVDAHTGAQLWSDRYEDQLIDLFHLQDRIAAHVAGAISPSVRAAEIAAARLRPPEDRGVYDLVLSAYPHFWAHRKEDNARAIELLSMALARDPDYPIALALRAWCRAQDSTYMWTDRPAEARENARSDAERAARLVVDHAPTLVAIGAAISLATAEQSLARSFIDRALAIDPNNAWGWMRAGWSHIYRREPTEALKCFDQAEALSPFDPFLFNVHFGKGSAYAGLREFPKAVALAERGLHEGPGVTWAYRLLAMIHAASGDMEKSAAACKKFLQHYPGVTIRKMQAYLPPSLSMYPDYYNHLRRAGIPEE